MTHPPAAMAKPAYKETNAFQAVGPLMKEHLGLWELSETKESKIAHVVNFFSDLIHQRKEGSIRESRREQQQRTDICILSSPS
jgi:hypothetical protein